MRAKKEAQQSHLMLPGRSVVPWHSQVNSHFGSWESWWIPKFSKRDRKGQNPLDWGVPYIIRKVLKLRCLKWACMNHLETSNTSYGQKKGRMSNWQFNFRPLKVKNRLILLCEGGMQQTTRKLSMRVTTLL